MAENSNIDDIKAPLLAALGAADLALATVNELITNLRERAEETRTDTRSRVEESRARLTKLQEDLPEQLVVPASRGLEVALGGLTQLLGGELRGSVGARRRLRGPGGGVDPGGVGYGRIADPRGR